MAIEERRVGFLQECGPIQNTHVLADGPVPLNIYVSKLSGLTSKDAWTEKWL